MQIKSAPDGAAVIGRFRAARRDPALAVLEGFHPLKHALRFGAEVECALSSDRERVQALAAGLAPDVAEQLARLVEAVPAEVFAQLSPNPPATGVIALARRPRVEVEALLAKHGERPLVLLERPTHHGNLGAVVRIAAAAGAAGVLTTGPHDPWHPAALRGSAGLHFALPVARVEALPEGERPLLAFDPTGEALTAGAIPADAVLAFGSEREGLSATLLARATRRLAIPMAPGVSSLNLASAVAIALYTWRLGTPSPTLPLPGGGG
jgi:RNA methyltransferase, TrmH family